MLYRSNDVFTGKVVNNNFRDCGIELTNKTITDLLKIYKADRAFYRKSFLGVKKKNQSFDDVLFSYSEEGWSDGTREKVRNYFLKYNYIFLTDPELSYLHHVILSNEYERSSRNNLGAVINKTNDKDVHGNNIIYQDEDKETEAEENVIFTALIGNKEKINNNAILALRFLRSLRLGLLKTNISLATFEVGDDIKNAFISSTTEDDDMLQGFYENSFKFISGPNQEKNLFLDESYFCNDLHLLRNNPNNNADSPYPEYRKFILNDKDFMEFSSLPVIYDELKC